MKVPFLDLSRLAARHRREFDAALARVMERGQFILGPELAAFETELAAALGSRFAIGVGNGTQALELILRARGIGPGAEVLVPALTSPFTALAVLAAGAAPVFVDVDPETLLLDASSAKRAITPRTRAVVPVHLYGRVASLQDLEALGVDIVQDAAHAHGARLVYRHPAAFSFYPTKNLGALGDGGAVLTDDEELAARLRRLRNGGQREYGVVTDAGVNSRLDEMQAALLRVLLPHLPAHNARRHELARQYVAIRPPAGGVPEDARAHAFHLYVIRSAERAAMQARFAGAGIGTAIHYPVPLHQMPLFAKQPVPSLPSAEAACREILSLPLHPELTGEEAHAVCAILES